ncbi:MAG: ThuA domain-containing protein [Phycisphaerae bacterium]|nr:ThuA domain-containing protein [Phycisphaerae bacterium]
MDRTGQRHSGARLTRRGFLKGTAGATGLLAMGAGGKTWAVAEADWQAKVEAALPGRAAAVPKRPRKLLIFDLNVGYGGHGSIPTANYAFTRMGEKTGTFSTVVSRDPAVFAAESLKQFDAVFFNNNVGNLFVDPVLRQNLIDFVYGGGGLMGVHGTTVAFTRWTEGAAEDWPEFGIMLGARGANHRAADERVMIRLDDPGHPVVGPFGGKPFEYRDELFRYQQVYSRNRNRVLMSIDIDKSDLKQGKELGNCFREDGDYALAWVRQYGRGRVFHCTIAHNPSVFWDPKMLEFYLGATQFVLGDLAAPTTPSAKLTEAVRAQEKLGWRVALSPKTGEDWTLFEAIDRAAELGLLNVSAEYGMKVSNDLSVPFDSRLNDDQRRAIRLKLDAACARLLACRTGSLNNDPAEFHRTFDFLRKMGIETVIAKPTEKTENVASLSSEFGIHMIPEDSSAAAGAAPIHFIEVSKNTPKAELIAAVERINQLSIQQAQKGHL